jgi:hypothetical protein
MKAKKIAASAVALAAILAAAIYVCWPWIEENVVWIEPVRR